jgi:branched-chain amino acid transport system substrate-binding protein
MGLIGLIGVTAARLDRRGENGTEILRDDNVKDGNVMRILTAGLIGLATAVVGFVSIARAQAASDVKGYSHGVIRIGVLTDMSGPQSAASGPGAVAAARMAAEDFGNAVNGVKVEILFADHQGKPDIGAAIARHWFDVEGVDAIADLQGSPIGLAVQSIARERHKILLLSSSTSSEFTGKSCSPTTVQWTVDTYSLAVSAARAMTEIGGKRWFFLTVDQAYGHALTRDTMEQVKRSGGTIVGDATFPAGNMDFAPLLLQAQSSGADVLALASASGDTITAMKQAAEFGLNKTMKIIPLQSVLTDIHAIGLPIAQGTYETAPFYWNRTDATRAWSMKFFARTNVMPSGFQAGVYSAVYNYLAAVQRAGTDDPDAVMRQLRATTVHDFFADPGKVRVDGKMVHDMYLLRVKKPSESSGEWDLYDVVKTLPGDALARPLSESPCPLVSKVKQ